MDGTWRTLDYSSSFNSSKFSINSIEEGEMWVFNLMKSVRALEARCKPLETDRTRLMKEVSMLKEEYWKEQIKAEKLQTTLSERNE